MSESKTETPKIRKGGCIYRVFVELAIRSTGEWIPGGRTPGGVIADLSGVSDAMLRRLLETHRIETADPTADQPVFNTPPEAARREPCPCGR